MGAFQLPGVIECGEPHAPLPPDPHYQWMGGGGRGVVSQKSILLGVTQYSISDLETFLLTADPLHPPIRKAPYSLFCVHSPPPDHFGLNPITFVNRSLIESMV